MSKKTCEFCEGIGVIGFPPEECYYCDGKGFTESKEEIKKKSYSIYEVIHNDNDLLILFQNDTIFKKSIDYGYHQDWSNEKILLFALKQGYIAKQNISDEYEQEFLNDRRPLKLETTNVCPKCKKSKILRFENNSMSKL